MSGKALIIGGGIGGLFTGAFLARNGVKVTVLEKNAVVGGGLQCFYRKGKIFETGMHILGGFGQEGNLTRICDYLGILDKIELQHIPAECMDEIKFFKTDDVFRIPSGKEPFIQRMSEYFPNEAEGIRKYIEKIFDIAGEVPLFNLEEDPQLIRVHSEEFTIPADELISRYIKDPKLREILAYLSPLYGGIAGETPAYVHALINVFYLNGASRFVGGSQQLADALSEVIKSNGGNVISGNEVKKIEIRDRKVEYVEGATGEIYNADWYISSVHPVELLRLASDGAFNKAFISRMNETPVSYSSFSLFIDLKPRCFPYVDHTCYFMEDYGEMWNLKEFDATDWPKGFMYMTPPDPGQGEFAGRMLVNCIMSFEQVKRWENSYVGSRGNDYVNWKRDCQNRIIAKLEKIFPGFKGMIKHVYSASPLTIRDYYHTRDGAIFGNRKNCNNMMLSQLQVNTKIKNLHLTGQNINLHGICGVPLTSILTSEAILGRNMILDQLKKN